MFPFQDIPFYGNIVYNVYRKEGKESPRQKGCKTMEKIISAHINDEFIEALTTFANTYVSRIKFHLFSRASEIADNDTLRTLLLEYNRRAKKREEEYLRDAAHLIRYGFTCYNEDSFEENCLNHASAYHKVLSDMLEEYMH